MSRQLTKVSEKFAALDAIVEQSRELIESTKGDFALAGATAMAMQALREGISDEVLNSLIALQNSPLGFQTDNKAGYPKEVVRDCYIEATLRGLRPVGNEFNIIAGRCYAAQAGYRGKLSRLKGFTDLVEDYGVPAMKESGAVVRCKATWKMNGKEDSKECEIPIRVNSGMGVDAVLGKAQRKLLKRVFEQATGKSDMDEEDPIDTARPANVTNVRTTTAPTFGAKQTEMV